MVRKIRINGSDKIICKYYDHGYCRFKEECKFFHPSEVCETDHCDPNVCQKRHPKFCRYFRRKKCKFRDQCLFKHTIAHLRYGKETDENKELKKKLKYIVETIKNLNKK